MNHNCYEYLDTLKEICSNIKLSYTILCRSDKIIVNIFYNGIRYCNDDPKNINEAYYQLVEQIMTILLKDMSKEVNKSLIDF